MTEPSFSYEITRTDTHPPYIVYCKVRYGEVSAEVSREVWPGREAWTTAALGLLALDELKSKLRIALEDETTKILREVHTT